MSKYRWLCKECGNVVSWTMEECAGEHYGRPTCCECQMELLKDQKPKMTHLEALDIVTTLATTACQDAMAKAPKDVKDDSVNDIYRRYLMAIGIVVGMEDIIEQFADLATQFENLRFC